METKITKTQTTYRGIPMEVFLNTVTKNITAVISLPNSTNNKPHKISGSAKLRSGDNFDNNFGVVLAKKRAYLKMQKALLNSFVKVKRNIDNEIFKTQYEIETITRKINGQVMHKYPSEQFKEN